MNPAIDPVFWKELKNKVLKTEKEGRDGSYVLGFCDIADEFVPVWESEKKFIQRHAKNFLKQNPKWNRWHISDLLLFRTLDFRSIETIDLEIRIDFCEYMEKHCTENPYTTWEKFVINIKTRSKKRK